MKRPKNVVWQSAGGRVTSDHCRATVKWVFSKNFQTAWNVQKTLFDSRLVVAWPPITVEWPYSDFFQNLAWLLETFKKRCLTVGRRSRDSRSLSRDRRVTFFKNVPNCSKLSKNVVWQSADGRMNSDYCRMTEQRLFSKFFLIAWNVWKRCLTVGRRSRDLRPLSSDRSVSVFKNSSNFLKRSKNVVWLSADGRVTSDHCRVTVLRLFSKFFLISWNFWKRCLTVVRRSLLSQNCSVTFIKIFPHCKKRPNNVMWQSADGRVTSDDCRVTVQRFSF